MTRDGEWEEEQIPLGMKRMRFCVGEPASLLRI